MGKIPPGTIAAIAASLMAQGESLAGDSEIFGRNWLHEREKRIQQFVTLAREIAAETLRQEAQHAE